MEEQSRIMEFNFFVVSKKNNIGLYQTYHQSCSLRESINLLRRDYRTLLEAKKDSYIQTILNEGGTEGRAKKLAREKYKGTLLYNTLIRKDELGDVINELDSIRSFDVDFLSIKPEQKSFSSISGLITKQRQSFTFQRSNKFITLKNAIINTISSSKPVAGRVYGKENGLDRIIKITENPGNYGEYDFDEVLSKIHSLNVKDFHNSWVIEKLLEACGNNPAIFDSDVAP